MKSTKFLVAAVSALAASTLAIPSYAAAPPCSTAKLIVPWGPGGGTAVLFGLFERYMNEHGAKPKIKVVTIPGQGGNKGAKQAVKAKADGCTLFAIHQSAIISYLSKRAKFNWDGFETVAHLTVTPSILAASPKAPFKDYGGMLKHLKANPGQVKTGASLGATSHFIWLMYGEKTGTSNRFIPVQGGTGKRKQLLMNNTFLLGEMNEAAAKKEMISGAVIPIAIAATKRSPTFPNIPTLREKGVDLIHALNRGIVVPKGTSKDMIAHWAAAFKKPLQDPAFVKQIAAKGTGLEYKGPSDYAAWFKAQTDIYTKVHAMISK
jgi:tripartite-type tricarboxylate transporter receptor subunit TctC